MLTLQYKGFGTNLAMYGDRLLHSMFLTDPEAAEPLKEYLVDLFTCITDKPNPDRFSLLGKIVQLYSIICASLSHD